MVKRKNIEEELANQMEEVDAINKETIEAPKPKMISENILNPRKQDIDNANAMAEIAGMSKLGENIFKNKEIRDGWIPVNRELLGNRSVFYPNDWNFKIRPATVEAIRNWSLIDENNGNSIDEVFNEIIKNCVSISSESGNPTWQNINNWDRFFFVLLVREYTFINGESKIEFSNECPNCENSVTFNLTADSLMYDLPDEEIMDMYDVENKCWHIVPTDFDVDADIVTLYVPTIEKDMNIKAWMINEYTENQNKKFDPVFIKFLPWLLQKISKDNTIAKQQIRKAELMFKSWNADMFSFMDEVLRNVAVTPKTEMLAVCPYCGEEVTAKIKFPNGISNLFNVGNKHKKFGSK